LVLGDADGVVVIEREKAEALLQLAEKKVASEVIRMEGIRQGTQLRPAWLEDALRAAGVLKLGETL
jgi:regulator of RNase E activity RraA